MASIASFPQISPTETVLYSLTITVLVALYLLFVKRPSLHSKAPPLTSGVYPIVGALGFFNRRWDFFKLGAAASPTGNFSFYVGKKPIVGLTSDASRQAFFDNKNFSFMEGYAGLAEGFSVLFGPSSKPKEEEKQPVDFGKYFNSRMLRVLRRDVLQRNLSGLIKDTKARLSDLAREPNGITDPFESIYKAVFQLTMRTVGCNDIAEDLPLISKLLHWYETVEKTTSPAAIMFPWLPTYAMIRRTIAGGRLFMTIKNIGDQRVKDGKRGDDPMQILIDQGDDMSNIVGVSMPPIERVVCSRGSAIVHRGSTVCCTVEFWYQCSLGAGIPLC